jgi:hypothetical protein
VRGASSDISRDKSYGLISSISNTANQAKKKDAANAWRVALPSLSEPAPPGMIAGEAMEALVHEVRDFL